ncbi:transcriptional regulator [soil metagenome]
MNKPLKHSRKLKLIKIGNSVGVILPKEVLATLRVGQGDEVYLNDAPHGFVMSARDPDFAKAMSEAEEIMREDRDILAVLAR